LSSIHDVIIVGSGPAGLTAAIYAARANLAPLVIEGEPSSTGDQPGGQLMLTSDVENYPGFVDAIMGPDLMGKFRAQAARFGAEILTSKVSRVDLSDRPFSLWIDEGTSADSEGRPDTTAEPTFQARSLIIATGARALMLGLPAEQRLLGRGVSTCATCDGFFFKERPLGVVGGGDSAIEEALFLTKFAKTVTVIHRRKELRASKIMQDRAFRNPKIDFRWDSQVTEILGEGSVDGVRLRDVTTGEQSTLDLGGLFVAIGHAPNTDLFKGKLAMDKNGYISTHDGSRTSVEGVFASGDVQDSAYRQAVTAAGSGCMAAIDAERWLEATEHAAAQARSSA
jgi:thioredoxin reductase (NADPH)